MDSQRVDALIAKYQKKPSRKLRKELTEELAPVVTSIARKFRYRGESVEDLFQIGSEGMLKGINYYSSTKHAEFLPYIVSMIVGEIKHYYRDAYYNVRIPRKYVEIVQKINAFSQEYTQRKKGGRPTIKEISTALGLPQELVIESMEAMNLNKLTTRDYKYISNAHDLKGEHLPQEDCMDGKLATRILIEDMIKVLPYREQKIIQLYFIKNITQKEIAVRFKITQAHVFRILNKALQKCKLFIEKSG